MKERERDSQTGQCSENTLHIVLALVCSRHDNCHCNTCSNSSSTRSNADSPMKPDDTDAKNKFLAAVALHDVGSLVFDVLD